MNKLFRAVCQFFMLLTLSSFSYAGSYIGFGFGMTHFKGFGDYKSKACLKNAYRKSKKLMQQIAI